VLVRGIQPGDRYLFIDGGYLRRTAQDLVSRYFPGGSPALDYAKLGKDFRRVFYYDCLSKQRGDETPEAFAVRREAQLAEFNALSRLPGFHIRQGFLRRDGKKNTQKGVDVSIAVDMLTHTIRGNMERATLLTGDLDFEPLIAALVQEGMYVTLWYDPSTTNDELVMAADEAEAITLLTIYRWSRHDWQCDHPIPDAVYVNAPGIGGVNQLIESGTTEEGFPYEIRSDGHLHYFIAPTAANPDSLLRVHHANLQTLKLYVGDHLTRFSAGG
jgi:uncharacterized LabA/DUF88 family protein